MSGFGERWRQAEPSGLQTGPCSGEFVPSLAFRSVLEENTERGKEGTMRYGVHVNSGAAVTDPSVLRDLGQVAEDLGYESILIGDHVMPPRKITTPFPLKMEHPPWQVYQEQPWPDCFVM